LGPHIKKIRKEKNTKKLKKYWKKIKKKYISKKNIYLNAQEIVEDWLRKIKIYKIENFNIVFFTNEDLISKGKFNLRREIQNWMFKDLIGTFQGLIEFNEGLI
jgi:coproporphyrinogen III oxidase-like Fe-S oxidoreductase